MTTTSRRASTAVCPAGGPGLHLPLLQGTLPQSLLLGGLPALPHSGLHAASPQGSGSTGLQASMLLAACTAACMARCVTARLGAGDRCASRDHWLVVCTELDSPMGVPLCRQNPTPLRLGQHATLTASDLWGVDQRWVQTCMCWRRPDGMARCSSSSSTSRGSAGSGAYARFCACCCPAITPRSIGAESLLSRGRDVHAAAAHTPPPPLRFLALTGIVTINP